MLQLVIAAFALIGIGATSVFTYRWLTGDEIGGTPTVSERSTAAGSEFVTSLEFTPDALRTAVEAHGVECSDGWQSDENGAQICEGQRGYYAILEDPLERVIDGYVSGPLLDEDPDQYVIATADAALIVPGEDIGWLYKVWDDCGDCYGWMTGGRREEPTDFTVDGLTAITDEVVDCYWDDHGDTGYSACAYSDDATGMNWLAGVFDLNEEYARTAFDALQGNSGSQTSISAGVTGYQVFTSEGTRFITPSLMRACQVSGPCHVQVGEGSVQRFDPATPQDVDDFFSTHRPSVV